MTWKEFMFNECGYDVKTTFWEDFSIAEKFGVNAIRDTYERAFNEWKGNAVYITELVIVLNHKIWETYETNDEFGRLYDELWRKCDGWCCENLKGEDLDYYYRTTD